MSYAYAGKQTIEQELAAAQAEVESRKAAAAQAREQLRTLKAAKRQSEQIAAQQEANTADTGSHNAPTAHTHTQCTNANTGNENRRKEERLAKDTRPYFTLTNEYPRHRKIRTLSDKAFRLHVELIADCNEAQSDGHFTEDELNMRGDKPGQELITKGLVEKVDGGYRLHDYLSHQHSKEQIQQFKAKKVGAGAFGAHTRHHVKNGVFDPLCNHCQEGPGGLANA